MDVRLRVFGWTSHVFVRSINMQALFLSLVEKPGVAGH